MRPRVRIRRDMAITWAEFLRTLPAALDHAGFETRGRECRIDHDGGLITIRLGTTAERRIGSLRLPLTPVEFEFDGLDEPSRNAFMQRFDRYFQRGGG